MRTRTDPEPTRTGARVYRRRAHPWRFEPAHLTREEMWRAGAAYGYARARADMAAMLREIERLRRLIHHPRPADTGKEQR